MQLSGLIAVAAMGAAHPTSPSTGTVAPPPLARVGASTDPSLQETENFIAGKLREQGLSSSIFKYQYKMGNNITTATMTAPLGLKIAFDQCRMSYKWHDGDTESFYALSEISAINIQLGGDVSLQDARTDAVKSGADGDISVVIPQTPPFFQVTLQHGLDSDGTPALTQIRFLQRDIAERVAKAFAHAVTLCGGGQKEAF